MDFSTLHWQLSLDLPVIVIFTPGRNWKEHTVFHIHVTRGLKKYRSYELRQPGNYSEATPCFKQTLAFGDSDQRLSPDRVHKYSIIS